MAALVDANGDEAQVGKTMGLWLSEDDFTCTEESLGVLDYGRLGFPRNWPTVYKESKPLKSLIGKKGACAGKKVGVVEEPSSDELSQVRGVTLHPLQSFSNAERVAEKTGMEIVYGWACYELLDKPEGSAFATERFWWNAAADGTWVDFTPRAEGGAAILLVEALHGAPKTRSKLTAAQADIARNLFGVRFPALASKAAKPAKAVETATPKPDRKAAAAPKAAKGSVAEKIAGGDVAAVTELAEKVKDNEEMCLQVVREGVIPPLVSMLSDDASRLEAARLLVLLTDAGVSLREHDVHKQVIDAGAIPSLIPMLSSSGNEPKETAAAILGNLCHESHSHQEKIAKAGAIKILVDLLSDAEGPAQEAAYAIWNLTVGHEENSAKVVRRGGVPKLVALLNSSSDVAQENAAGALMHIAMSDELREAVVAADAIPRLCALLSAQYEPEVSSQAAGALLNLASDSTTHSKAIVARGAVPSLLALVKDGPDLAREYAAGALMNVTRGDTETAKQVAAGGGIPLLSGMVQKGTGSSEALGALANLASSSSERQIAIYKAQVTRKMVTMLGDSDVDVRRGAAALIMNMAPHAKIKERIVEAGALKPLARLLSDSDQAIQERAAGALANIFNDHRQNVQAGYNEAPEMIPALVQIISSESPTEDARRQAAHALAMLAAEDDLCDAVWEAGAKAPLLALIDQQVGEAALGIMNLSWRWPEVKVELANEGAIQSLLAMLEDGDEIAREYAAGALMNLTAGSDENASEATSGVASLVRLLSADVTQAAEWGAGALANIVRAGESVRREAVQLGVPALLVQLLAKATPNGQALVLLTFIALAESEANAVKEALRPAKARLRQLRDGSGGEHAESVQALLEKLPDFTL